MPATSIATAPDRIRFDPQSSPAMPAGADTDLVGRQLERVAVERIPSCAQLLPIRDAMGRIRTNAICRGENERNDREISIKLESKVDALRSFICPAPMEADVHVEAMTFQAKAVGHLDVNDGGQT